MSRNARYLPYDGTDPLAPPVDLTQYATPLSLVRALETEFASTTLMTVSGVGEDGRVRALPAMDFRAGGLRPAAAWDRLQDLLGWSR